MEKARHHDAVYCTYNDFLHRKEYCTVEACKQTNLMWRQVQVGEEANELKRRELDMREDNEWVEEKPRPRPRQTYILPPTPQPERPTLESLQTRGGINIDPAK
jgi:hypothetical protein